MALKRKTKINEKNYLKLIHLLFCDELTYSFFEYELVPL